MIAPSATYDEMIQKSYGFDLEEQERSIEWKTVRSLYERNCIWNQYSSNPNDHIGKIPKVIHQIWLGPKNMPVSYVRYADSWIQKNPSWGYRLWTEGDLKDIEITNKKLFNMAINQGMRSDMLRYEILRQYGGVYVDMDFECLKPFDDLTYLEFFTGIGYDKKLQLYIGLMGSVPNHDIMIGCTNNMTTNYAGDKGSIIIDVTGVNYFTKQFFNCVNDKTTGVVAFPMEYFYPFPNDRRGKDNPYGYVTENSYALHHWGISWSKKIQDGLDTRR